MNRNLKITLTLSLTTCALGMNAQADTGSSIALDFLVANVCVDAQGKTLVGVSPIDGDPRCVSQRDLRVGEPLPYHVRQAASPDAPSPSQVKGSDSFPVNSKHLGVLPVHIYDYAGYLPGHTFGFYDSAHPVGGGTISAISGTTASFIATQLGPQEIQYFVGGGCTPNQPVTYEGLEDSWTLASLDKLNSLIIPSSQGTPKQSIIGGIVSVPGRMVNSSHAVCPAQIPNGTTRWSVQPVIYRAIYKSGVNKGQHVVLWSLVSEHDGSDSSHLGSALAFERAYFTRELGWTRWEAWKVSTNGNAINTSASYCQQPNQVSGSSAYAPPEAPLDANGNPRTDMVLTGCTEVTEIVQPKNAGGDPAPVGANTWIGSITASPLADELSH